MCGDWISLDDEVRRIIGGLEVVADTPPAQRREHRVRADWEASAFPHQGGGNLNGLAVDAGRAASTAIAAAKIGGTGRASHARAGVAFLEFGKRLGSAQEGRSPSKFKGGEQTVTKENVTRQTVPLRIRR